MEWGGGSSMKYDDQPLQVAGVCAVLCICNKKFIQREKFKSKCALLFPQYGASSVVAA